MVFRRFDWLYGDDLQELARFTVFLELVNCKLVSVDCGFQVLFSQGLD